MLPAATGPGWGLASRSRSATKLSCAAPSTARRAASACGRAAAAVIEAAEEARAAPALRELVESTFVLAGAKWPDGETEGVYQMGVEGLHFGSAYAAAQAALQPSDETIARAETRPAHIELPAGLQAAANEQAARKR